MLDLTVNKGDGGVTSIYGTSTMSSVTSPWSQKELVLQRLILKQIRNVCLSYKKGYDYSFPQYVSCRGLIISRWTIKAIEEVIEYYTNDGLSDIIVTVDLEVGASGFGITIQKRRELRTSDEFIDRLTDTIKVLGIDIAATVSQATPPTISQASDTTTTPQAATTTSTLKDT